MNTSILKDLSAETLDEKSLPLMLIVEDNLLAQRMVIRFVESLGFKPDIANTGAEAVVLFKPGKYKTAWMDVGLPDFDGYEVVRRIRKMEEGTGFRVPIIGVSAHAVENLAPIAETGFDAMLTKPLRPELAKTLLVKYGVI